MKMNQDLMEFIQKIICLKNKGWGVLILGEYADVGTHWIALCWMKLFIAISWTCF